MCTVVWKCKAPINQSSALHIRIASDSAICVMSISEEFARNLRIRSELVDKTLRQSPGVVFGDDPEKVAKDPLCAKYQAARPA